VADCFDAMTASARTARQRSGARRSASCRRAPARLRQGRARLVRFIGRNSGRVLVQLAAARWPSSWEPAALAHPIGPVLDAAGSLRPGGARLSDATDESSAGRCGAPGPRGGRGSICLLCFRPPDVPPPPETGPGPARAFAGRVPRPGTAGRAVRAGLPTTDCRMPVGSTSSTSRGSCLDSPTEMAPAGQLGRPRHAAKVERSPRPTSAHGIRDPTCQRAADEPRPRSRRTRPGERAGGGRRAPRPAS
jgi:hypothetical protein